MKRQNVRTLSLVICTFTYLLIGAAVFDALESGMEQKRWEALQEMQNSLKAKYNISDDDYELIEAVIIRNVPHKAGPQWKFAGSFYFATVVMAMIGYGHSTPATVGGKAFCMLYAVIGIPLGLVMFQSIGERLNKFASVVICKMKKLLKCKNSEALEVNLLLATGILSSIIITAGAAMFSHYEQWTYFDALYYCYITLTTIGFGDFVALQNDNALTERPEYVAMSLVFILFGLAVVAASMNLLVLRFMTINAEDLERRDEEMFPASQHVVTLDDELAGSLTSLNHREGARHSQENMRKSSNVKVALLIDDDQVSVCSCSCYGRPSKSRQDYPYEIARSPGADSEAGTEERPKYLSGDSRGDLYSQYLDPYLIKRASL